MASNNRLSHASQFAYSSNRINWSMAASVILVEDPAQGSWMSSRAILDDLWTCFGRAPIPNYHQNYASVHTLTAFYISWDDTQFRLRLRFARFADPALAEVLADFAHVSDKIERGCLRDPLGGTFGPIP